MISSLNKNFPNFSHIEESTLLANSSPIGWQVSAIDNEGIPLGTGFSPDLNYARKVAIAEFVERSFFHSIKFTDAATDWKIDSRPTVCGFAAGYEPRNTALRSLYEATERWALAQWIDNGKSLNRFQLPAQMHSDKKKTVLALLEPFGETVFLKKTLVVAFQTELVEVNVIVCVAFTEKGVFLGSAASNSFEDGIVHAAVESNRHFIISNQDRNFGIFPLNKIRFFGTNRIIADTILARPLDFQWQSPCIDFSRQIQIGDFYICRTILREWTPWEQGPIERFLY